MKSKTGAVTSKRIFALLLCMVMMFSMVPTAAFATGDTPAPAETSAPTQAPAETEKPAPTETPATLIPTAVALSEENALVFIPVMLNVDMDDAGNDLAAIPEFYIPVIADGETGTSLFFFTDKDGTARYRIYGSYGDATGFFACGTGGTNVDTSAVITEAADRALLPVNDASPAEPQTDPELVALSEEGQAFIDAVNTLDKDAMLAAVRTYKAAQTAAAADPENAELAAAAAAAEEAVDTATAPLNAAMGLYDDVPVTELTDERVEAAMSKLAETVNSVQTALNAAPAAFTSTGAVEVKNLTVSVNGTDYPVGDAATVTTTNTFTMSCLISGDVSWMHRTIAIDIPMGWRLVSGPGVKSVGNNSYVQQTYTPEEDIAFLGFPTWVADAHIQLTENFDLWPKSGTLTYNINEGTLDFKLTLTLQAEDALYNYSGEHTLAALSVTMTGVDDTDPSVTSTDTKTVGAKLGNCTMVNARSFINSNPYASTATPDAASAIIDQTQQVRVGAMEDCIYNGTDVHPSKYAYNTYFDYVYPTGATVTLGTAGWTMSAPVEDTVAGTSTVRVSTTARVTYRATDVRALDRTFCIINLTYPDNAGFVAGQVYQTTVKDMTWQTAKVNANGTVDWLTHVANNDPQTNTTLVAKKTFQPPYYAQSLNSERKNGYDGVLQTLLNVSTRLCGNASGAYTSPDDSISGPSATKVRFTYKGDALDNTTYMLIAVSTTVTSNAGNLESIHIEFTDNTSIEWNQGGGALPGVINYDNTGGRGTSWQYTAPEGMAIKSAYVQYSKVTEDEAASGTWGRCLAQGRPVNEKFTGTYSHHTFYTQQWDGNAWVTVSTSDIAGEDAGNYQSYLNHGGFRWERPADFFLVEVGTNGSPVNSYDGVGRTGSENCLVPAQTGIVKLATYTFTNSTGSFAENPVRVDFDLNTNAHKDDVTAINFPIPYLVDADESARYVTKLEWIYDDGGTGSWDASSGAPMPFTVFNDRTNSYGSFTAEDGRYLADFTVYLSDWNASTHVASTQIIGHPTEDNRFNVYSAHTITVTTTGAEENQINTATAGFDYRSSTAQYVSPFGRSIELNAGSAGALQVELQAGYRLSNGTAGVNEENSQWYGHVTFAFILPNDITPDDEAQVTWPHNAMGYGSTTATLQSSHTASAEELAAANMSGLNATVYVYDFDRQDITWIGRYPNRASTRPQVVLPIEVNALAPDYTFTYAQIFYAGSNRGPELNDGAAIPLNGPAVMQTTYTDGDAEKVTSTVSQTDANVVTDLGVTANAVRGDSATLVIHKDPALVVQEHIAASDGDYKVFNADSPVYASFAADEEGTICLKVFNTVNDEAIVVKDGYVFLPIPKTSGNSALVTEHAFDFTLNGVPVITDGSGNFGSIEIAYITDATEPTANNAPTLFALATQNYSPGMAASVTMVAFKLHDLRAGTGMEVKIPIKAPSVISNEMIFDQYQARSVYLYTPTAWTTFNSGERFGYLRAGYINPQWTVSFESNGGTQVDDQLVMDGQKATEQTPTRSGYTFGGWYTEDDFQTLYDFNTPVTEDFTLYAKWTEKDSVVIRYTTDEGGSLSKTEETLPPATGNAVGSTVTVSDGYTFVGWFDESDAPVGMENGFVPAKVNGLNVAATYHAKISPNSDTPYKVEYYQESMTAGVYAIVASETVNSTGATNTAPTVTQKTFDGFTYNNTTYEDSGHTTAQAEALNISGDGSLVVKLYYTRNECIVTFSNAAHGGTLVDGANNDINTTTYKQTKKAGETADNDVGVKLSEGYVHVGWSYVMTVNSEQRTGTLANYTALTLLGDTQFTPIFAKPPYVVINSTGNGFVAASEKGSTIVPATVTDTTAKREWAKDGDVATDVALAFKAKEHYKVSSITLQMPQSYNVDPLTPIPIPLENGTNIGTLALGMLKPGGSATLNLADDKKSGSIVIQSMDDNCVFTVSYAPINFTATFDSDGGTPAPGVQTVQEGSLVTDPGAPSKDGYSFGGWQYQDGEAWKDYDFDTAMTGDILLKAKWTENTVTIVYRSEDTSKGAVSVGSETRPVISGTAQGSVATPQTGYHFVNWTDSVGTQMSDVAAFAPEKVGGKNVAATYTAHFAPNIYMLTIRYVYADGSEAAPNVVRDVAFNSTYSVDSPVIDGYKADKKNISGTMGAGDEEFTVTYTAPTSVAAELSGTKLLTENGENKSIAAGQFSFSAVAAAGNDTTGYTGFNAGNADADANGGFTFGDISFTKAGNYSFIVSEVAGSAAGYTYDEEPVTVTYAVKWNETDNILYIDNTICRKGGATVNGVTFTNTYETPAAAEVHVTGQKNLTGGGKTNADIAANQFTFTVTRTDENGFTVNGLPTEAVGAEAATGALDFGTWSFAQVGQYTFRISENDVAAGYSKAADVTATVDVTLDSDTNSLNSAVTYSGGGALIFANNYAAPAAIGIPITGSKTLTGGGKTTADITAAQFTFTMTRTDTNGFTVTGLPTGSVSVAAGGALDFDTWSFSKAGTYQFTISEEDIADTHYAKGGDVTVTVVIGLDETDNTLTSAVTYSSGDTLTIANTYAPNAASAAVSVTKTVTGILPTAASFEFTIAQTGGETANVTMPANDKVTTAEITTGSAAAVSFGSISFSAPGEYRFSVTETNSNIPNMSYAPAQTVTVNVTDNAGTLEAAVTPNNGALSFTNGYVPTPATITDAKLTVLKTVTGTLPTAASFEFTIARTDSGDADAVTMPTSTTATTTEITTGSAAAVSFGDITFKAAGIYTFSVTETVSNIPGMTYAPAQTVTVKVTDTNGVLSAAIVTSLTDNTPASGRLTFTNDYVPNAAALAVPAVTKSFGSITPTAGETFTFTMTAKDAAYPMPVGSTGTVKTITSTGAALNEQFGSVSFTAAGQFVYTIKEAQETLPGYTYDTTEYTWTVDVVDNGGTLNATGKLTKPSPTSSAGEEVTAAAFANPYNPTANPYVIPTVTKVVSGGHIIPANKDFTFVLTQTDGNEARMPADSTGKTKTITISGAGSGVFGQIDFDGTTVGKIYTYTITETNGSEHGYTYNPDKVSYLITITTTDEVVGGAAAVVVHPTVQKLTDGANPVAATAVSFTNAYAPDAASYTPTATKVVTGAARPSEKSFTLALTPAKAANPMPAGLETDGSKHVSVTGSSTAVTGSFGAISFTKAGSYEYTITELNNPAEAGYTYDLTSYTLTVTVTDTDGVLSAEGVVTKTGEAGRTTAAFKNVYAPVVAKVTKNQLTVTKTLTGNELPTAETFEFTLARTDNGAATAVTMPAATRISTAAITKGSAAAIGFDDITFNADGTYTFSVTETNAGMTGMSYAPAQTVTVTVTDTNGVLTAAITSPADGKLTFTNSYAPRSVTPADPPVRKAVTGDTPATPETFNFTMTAISYTAPNGSTRTMTPAQMPMPSGSANGVKTASVSGAGAVEFGSYTYAHAGAYVYEIAETRGSNALYTYDATHYTITDTVTDTNGVLSYTRSISNGTPVAATEFVFTNRYTLPMGELSISKTVSGDLASKTQQFTFTVTLSTAGSFNYTGSKSGTISSGGAVRLCHGETVVLSLPAGTTYEITESGNYGYSVTSTGTTGTITANGRTSAAFTNTKSSVPKTGDDDTVRYGVGTMLLSFAGMCGLSLIDKLAYGKRRKKSK